MHIHPVDDVDGNIVDAFYFCSDFCHKEWCRNTGVEYSGWNGCHEVSDNIVYCAYCEELCQEYPPNLDKFKVLFERREGE